MFYFRWFQKPISVTIKIMKTLSTYFDAAASTPLHPEVRQTMIDHLDLYGNDNSKHIRGQESRKVIDDSLKTIAKSLGVSADQLAVTYSGTDANRRVIQLAQRRWGYDAVWGSHVEHSSVWDEISESQRFDPVTFAGLPASVKLACLMGANSETGRKYPLSDLKAKFPQTLILQDAAQLVAKYEKPDFDNADVVTFAPQKIYGPKMVGLVWFKNPEMWPEISKDSHTKNASLVVGMAKAFELWSQDQAGKIKHLKNLEQALRFQIQHQIPDIKFHEAESDRICGHINVAFAGVRGGELMTILSQKEGICISTGSACTSDIMAPTNVIRYIEPEERWRYPVRIGLHQFLTMEDVAEFGEILAHYVEELRKKA